MKKDKQKNSKNKLWIWSVKILLLAVFLSLSFSLISEIVLSKAHIVIAIIVILIFISISVLFDMLGLAVASSNVEDFAAMASRKVKGSKQALSLTKNADKVGSVCDVIGDVCGILSGAAGASIVAKIIINASGEFLPILIASLVSALIAGFTIFGKSVFKSFAIKSANSITLKFAKFINFFTHKG